MYLFNVEETPVPVVVTGDVFHRLQQRPSGIFGIN